MNTISNLRTAENTGKGNRSSGVQSTSAEREELMEEFSKLLTQIGTTLESQNQDAIMSIDITLAAPPVKTENPVRHTKDTWKETKKDVGEVKDEVVEVEKEVRADKKEIKKDAPEEVRKEEKEEVEATRESVEAAGAVDKEVKADEAEAVEVEEDVQLDTASCVSPEKQVVAETSAAEITASGQAAAPLVKNAAVQVEEERAAASEAAAVSVDAEKAELGDSEVKPAMARAEADQTGEQRESEGDFRQFVQQASEDAEGKEPADAGLKTGKPSAEVVKAAPEVQAAEEAIRNVLADKLSPEKTAVNRPAAAHENAFIQPVNFQPRVAAPSPSASLAMSLVREVAGITNTGGSGNGTSSMAAFGNANKGNETGFQHTQRTEQLPRTAQTRAIERIEDALKEVAKSKDGKTISFRLDPPELGSVKIEVSCKDGTLHAKLASDSQQVTQLIRDKAFDLQGVLRKLGLPFERVVVSVGQEQPQQNLTGQSFSSDSQHAGENQSDGGSLSSRLADLFPGMSEEGVSRGGQADDGWIA